MVTENELLDGVTTTKQNLAGEDFDSDDHIRIFRSKARLWNKLFRATVDGTEVAVVLPFNKLIEPLFNTEDIDSDETTGVYNTTTHQYELYSDLVGNYKTIQSRIISYQQDRKLRSVTITVTAEYADGSNATDGIDISLIMGSLDIDGSSFDYDFDIDFSKQIEGEVVVGVKSGLPVYTRDYVGADLDVDLDSDLYTSLANDDGSGNLLYQHELKWRIVRTSTNKIFIKKIILILDWEN